MTNRHLLVGIFVVASLALFSAGLFMIGNRHEAFVRHMDFYTEFADLSGIAKGAKVQVAGMDAGEVMEVAIPDSPSSKFRLRFQITEKLHGLVRADSVVTIGTEGVVGNKFLTVSSGTSREPAAKARETLRSKEPTELTDLLDMAKGTIADVDTTVRNANGLVTNAGGLLTTVGGNLNSTLGSVRKTVTNANDVVTELKEGQGPVGMLLRDQALSEQIRQAVANAQQVTVDLRQTSGHVNGIVSDIQSRGFPKKIDDTLAGAQETISNLNATSRQVRETVAEAAAPDVNGVAAAVNLRESLSNVNAAAGNLADETEALKHNFLLRGFFGRRGYYNLTHISPDQYRKDRVFASQGNHRIWLPADRVFVRNSSGADEIGLQGKSLLDDTLAQCGSAILQSPIVVEGYSDDAKTADRLANSHNRSILVRNYVQTRFQLDPNNLGAVALENHPPDGLDHSAWNGIAIVLLQAKR